MSIAVPVADPQLAAQPRPDRQRLRHDALSDSDRNFGIAMHLTPAVLFILGVGLLSVGGPIVLWLLRRKESAFNDDHGREVVNFVLSFLLWHLILAVTVVGLILWPVLWVVAIVNNIRGAIAAGHGEYFRYPMTIRFLS